jgi:glycosyltransferase involved in cell wall biosynthesis
LHIALIAPPFIPVPPVAYGGTELFIAHLAEALTDAGHRVTVYTNGESTVRAEVKWRYRRAQWPIKDHASAQLLNSDHTARAVRDAARTADIIHLNDIVGVPLATFVDVPMVHTLHHPHEPVLSQQYQRYPDVQYVAISAFQAKQEPMRGIQIVHHGLPLEQYTFRREKDGYLAFLGRMAPCKGPHLAIEAARRAGMPLKLAGEIQPVFHEYWEKEVAPRLGGDIEYVGEAGPMEKNELLSRARALLFPIQWNEPFGLVMIEAMACGTPVLAFDGGSVSEIVKNGVSGWICADVEDMAARAASCSIPADTCRAWADDRFSCERMMEGYVRVYERALTRSVSSAAWSAAEELEPTARRRGDAWKM